MTYTKDQLKNTADAMYAHLAEKPVQFKMEETWCVAIDPTFSSSYLWRPKPEPEPPKPWDCMADVPPSCWLRYHVSHRFLITKMHNTGVGTPDGLLKWSDLSEYSYSTTPADDASWKPCLKEPKPSLSPTVSE